MLKFKVIFYIKSYYVKILSTQNKMKLAYKPGTSNMWSWGWMNLVEVLRLSQHHHQMLNCAKVLLLKGQPTR